MPRVASHVDRNYAFNVTKNTTLVIRFIIEHSTEKMIALKYYSPMSFLQWKTLCKSERYLFEDIVGSLIRSIICRLSSPLFCSFCLHELFFIVDIDLDCWIFWKIRGNSSRFQFL
jgi:hypothetical protein